VGVLLGFTDKTRIHASEKLMAAVFRDMKGISSVEYMKKGSTITAEIYKETIRKFQTAIQQKMLHGCDQKIMPLHDNCRVYKDSQVREVIDECGFVEMECPTAQIWHRVTIISFLKNHLRRRRFF
jgi:hypothetical protein